ncbi:MAG: RNA polymerase sigma-70 factor (family 1) [Saprospiraceae bacterium]|jgi:RNA polymerase sigma-70 factor (family 1)
MDIEQKAILQSLKDGNRAAFDKIFRSYYKYLFTIAFTYLKDEHRAKDIIQDVFLDLWNRREKIEIEYSIKYFLRRAVINGSMAALRKTNRISYDITPITENVAVDDNDTLAYKEMSQIVKDAIISLPDKCQQVYCLSRDEGLSHKEIAQRLNISTKTIENHITKALKIIRIELKRMGLISVLLLIQFLIGENPY